MHEALCRHVKQKNKSQGEGGCNIIIYYFFARPEGEGGILLLGARWADGEGGGGGRLL